MTYKEAIIDLEQMKQTYLDMDINYGLVQSLNLSIEALEKQIPTSISKSWRDARGYTNTFICGKCKAHIQMPYMMNKCDYEYCPYCGNRLE